MEKEMPTNPQMFIGLGMPPALASAVASAIDEATAGGTVTAGDVTADAFTTAGGTEIPAGTVASQLQAVGDLADPAG